MTIWILLDSRNEAIRKAIWNGSQTGPGQIIGTSPTVHWTHSSGQIECRRKGRAVSLSLLQAGGVAFYLHVEGPRKIIGLRKMAARFLEM